jgi:hypothetical protein
MDRASHGLSKSVLAARFSGTTTQAFLTGALGKYRSGAPPICIKAPFSGSVSFTHKPTGVSEMKMRTLA